MLTLDKDSSNILDVGKIWHILRRQAMNINITLKPSIIRDCCIEHNLYTCGDNEEYEAMFQQAREENDLEKTARDIVEQQDVGNCKNPWFSYIHCFMILHYTRLPKQSQQSTDSII